MQELTKAQGSLPHRVTVVAVRRDSDKREPFAGPTRQAAYVRTGRGAFP